MAFRPARLVTAVIALSVAAVLTIFVVQRTLRGNRSADVTPSSLAGHSGDVVLMGEVVGQTHGDSYASDGLRFRLKDIGRATRARVPVVYRGSVPDLFKAGREVVIEGKLRHGLFVARPGSLVTKNLVSYVPAKSSKT